MFITVILRLFWSLLVRYVKSVGGWNDWCLFFPLKKNRLRWFSSFKFKMWSIVWSLRSRIFCEAYRIWLCFAPVTITTIIIIITLAQILQLRILVKALIVAVSIWFTLTNHSFLLLLNNTTFQWEWGELLILYFSTFNKSCGFGGVQYTYLIYNVIPFYCKY